MEMTVILGSGREVLARQLKDYGPYPVTYANRTQAEKAAAKLGDGWEVYKSLISRPFFVAKKGA